MIAHTKLSVYPMKFDLSSVPQAEIRVIELKPDAVIMARHISTGEVSEIEAHKLEPWLHTAFLKVEGVEETEWNVMHRQSKLVDESKPLPSDVKLKKEKG